MTETEKTICKIAKEYIYSVKERGGLDTRNNDSEDFIETSIWSLKAALIAAYNAGRSDK